MSATAPPRSGAVEAPPAPARPRHTARWVAGGVLAVLVAVSVAAATRPSVQATKVASPLLGQRAPGFAGTDLAGARVSLASYRGRYVYVNFFASWCPPCSQEEQALVDFDFQQSRRGTKAAGLVSVVFNDTPSAAAAFVTKWGARWPAVPDRDGTIANAYGVGSPPTTFLIDPRGYVAGVFDGPVQVSQLDSMLAEARRAGG